MVTSANSIESLRRASLFQGGALASYPTSVALEGDPKKLLKRAVKRIRKRQELLYADGSQAILFVFQGMDCAGKDSTIKHVLSGVNPAGVHVANFGVPTDNELAHSYMWRHWRDLPKRGRIGVFNRSYYEEVLVMRVHPEYFGGRQMPQPEINDAFWADRIADMVSTEEHLRTNGIHVVKFLLNVSKQEQARRLLDRIAEHDKHWKFNLGDMDERRLWPAYQDAFQHAIAGSHTPQAPWYVIPADDKPTMRALVATAMAHHLEKLDLQFPVVDEATKMQFDAAKEELETSLRTE